MTSRMLRAALAAALICTSSVSLASDFTFSFGTDGSDPLVTNGVPGTVTGRILGLPDDGTGSALQVLIDSYSPDGSLSYPIDATAWFSQWENSFTVAGGDIVAAEFHAGLGSCVDATRPDSDHRFAGHQYSRGFPTSRL